MKAHPDAKPVIDVDPRDHSLRRVAPSRRCVIPLRSWFNRLVAVPLLRLTDASPRCCWPPT